MTHEPQRQTTVAVDLANPGQFFACCGLLEIANRLWPGAEGWFEGASFMLSSEGGVDDAMDCLAKTRLEKTSGVAEPSIAPILLENLGLELNWWLRHDFPRFAGALKGKRSILMKSNLKLWAGNQSSFQIATKLQRACGRLPRPLGPAAFGLLTDFSSRFGLDTAPAWTALSVGFSINEHPKMRVRSSPLVELLAAVGLQRFRPVWEPKQGSLAYSTWAVPLSPDLASVVCAGQVSLLRGASYRFRLNVRGSYRAFTRATKQQGGGNNGERDAQQV